MPKIAHISDTHILLTKRHDEYREVFQKIYESCRQEKVDYIVHTGDLFHSKLQLTPEAVSLAVEFLKNLGDIAPTYIIAGNHDTNLRNNRRLDSISPIVDAIGSDKIHYLYKSGEYEIGQNIALNVLSIFDKENWKAPSDPSRINIALYHGSIRGVMTDTGYVIEHGDDTIDIFEGHDYALLGDIHLTDQKVDDEGRMRYAGSTVQQNFGETDDKGFLIWNIQGKDVFSVESIKIPNPKPFASIPLWIDGSLASEPVLPKGARIRLISDFSLQIDKVKLAIDAVKARYKPESVTYVNKSIQNKETLEEVSNLSKTLNLRMTDVQEEMIREYLKDYNPDSETLEKIYNMNKKYSTEVEQSEDVARNVTWSMKNFEWDNLFNYGEGNRVDFSKLRGVVGILGKNGEGKTSFLDSLLYTVFNTTSKNNRKNLNIINQNRDKGHGKLTIDIDGNEYVVERSSTKYTKKSKGVESIEAKTDVEFTTENEELLTGLDRSDTDKIIRRYVGTVDDFLLTSMASQLDSLAFINEGSTNRKTILAKFLDLDIFESKFKLAKSDAAEVKTYLKKHDGTDFDAEIQKTNETIKTAEIAIRQSKEQTTELNSELQATRADLLQTQSKMYSIQEKLPDMSDSVIRLSSLQGSKSTLEQWIRDCEVKLKHLDEKRRNIDVTEDISTLLEQKNKFDSLTKSLAELEAQYRLDSQKSAAIEKRIGLLEGVPCGNQYTSCKFIKDAHEATAERPEHEIKWAKLGIKVEGLEAEIAPLRALNLDDRINKYNTAQALLQKIDLEEKNIQLTIEKHNVKLANNKQEIAKYQAQIDEMNKRKEESAELEGLIVKEAGYKVKIHNLEMKLNSLNQEITTLYRDSGYQTSRLETLEEQKLELLEKRRQFAAYDLYLKAMHPNGISYQVIKNKLPVINSEINKILTNIVDFQVFLVNDDDKLDIMIKHPKYDPRPLEMGSGSEKSLASIAIRLALLTVSSLPRSDIFIMDEPGTSLDADNLAGFIRILDIIKGYFKVVFLISHLDILKDAVDMQINIQKHENFAHIDV
jgi:DNA repair exonuclease SbcCD ATPase subunit/DNA repair exonuclease SbcCD nuclease subunit